MLEVRKIQLAIGKGLLQLQYPQSCYTSFRLKQAVRIFYIQFAFQNIGFGIAICCIVLIIIKVIRQNTTYFTVYLFTSSLIATDDDFCPLAHSRTRVSSLLLSRIPSIVIVPAICFVIFSLLTIVSHLAFLILLYHINQQSKPIFVDGERLLPLPPPSSFTSCAYCGYTDTPLRRAWQLHRQSSRGFPTNHCPGPALRFCCWRF